MTGRFAVFALALAGSAAVAQDSRSTNATSIQNLRVKPGLACASDGHVLTWVAASLRFECLTAPGGGAGNPAGADTQVQWNNGGVFGATAGFDWTAASKRLRLGALGSEAALWWPSLESAYWHMDGSSSVLNSQRDNTFRWGWNMGGEDATEPQFGIQMETHYKDDTPPASRTSEFIVAYTSVAGASRRPLQINLFRVANGDASIPANAAQLVLSGEHSFKSSDQTSTPMHIADGGAVDVNNTASIYLRATNNGSVFLKQKRSDGAYSNLAYLSSANIWQFAVDDPVVTPSVFRSGSTSNSADYLAQFDFANRRLKVGVGNAADKGIVLTVPEDAGLMIQASADGSDGYMLSRSATTGYLKFVGAQTGFVGYAFNGGIQQTGGARPSCNAAQRGTRWYVAGAPGVLDTFELCRKDAANAYAWVTLF